jgi:phenylalanine-4-hydroxylase
MNESELETLGLVAGRRADLAFEGGVRVTGRIEHVRRDRGRTMLVTFADCRVVSGDRLLFDPAWGSYDMAVGERIVSVFHGAADKDAYEEVPFVPRERTIKVTVDEATRRLAEWYARVRAARERGEGLDDLPAIEETVRGGYPGDWLLSLEILELLARQGVQAPVARRIRDRLTARAAGEPDKRRLLENGLRLIGIREG